MDRGAWRVTVHGVTRVEHNLTTKPPPGKNTRAGCHFLLQGSSQPRDQTCISCLVGRFFTIWAIREALVKAIHALKIQKKEDCLMVWQHQRRMCKGSGTIHVYWAWVSRERNSRTCALTTLRAKSTHGEAQLHFTQTKAPTPSQTLSVKVRCKNSAQGNCMSSL